MRSGKDPKKPPADRYLSPAVEQASRVLLCLAASRTSHMSLTDICAQVGIHKSKAFSILETLLKFQLVRRNSDAKGYALGPGLVPLSRKVLDDLSPARLAQPILEELARKTRSTATLGLISGKRVFVAAKHEGEDDIGITMRIGHTLPITYGAHGKAIAAYLPTEERERLLREQDLYFHGQPARVDRTRLKEELAKCRRLGFAEDLGMTNRGLNVVTAPVFGANGAPIGYIEIFVLFSARTAHGFGALVSGAAKELSRQLGADLSALENKPDLQAGKRRASRPIPEEGDLYGNQKKLQQETSAVAADQSDRERAGPRTDRGKRG